MIGAEVQVILPVELAHKLPEASVPREPTNAVVAFDPAQYQIQHEGTSFRVEVKAPFQVLRPGDAPLPLFAAPVHLLESRVEPAEAVPGRVIAISNRLGLFTQRSGEATLHLAYRVPVLNREGKKRAQIPILLQPSGSVRLESPRTDLEVLTGSLWTKTAAGKTTTYDIGTAGEESVTIEWRDPGDGTMPAPEGPGDHSKEFYGIGLKRAQNLTIINSDGSCTHFAEFEVPVAQAEDFRLKLPAKARLISVSINGAEVTAPVVEQQMCRLRLPKREGQQLIHRLSFRIAYPGMPLGFVGLAGVLALVMPFVVLRAVGGTVLIIAAAAAARGLLAERTRATAAGAALTAWSLSLPFRVTDDFGINLDVTPARESRTTRDGFIEH